MGKTDLGKWMITNGGEYSADATYEQLTMVKYGNSTYITLKTVTGITPVDDKINYQLMAQGFDATALSAVQAEDTQGLCGEKGNIVTAQSLVDALADKVINTVMTKIGTAALTGGMTDLSSGLNALYSNLTRLSEIKVSSTSYDVPQKTQQTFTPMKLSAGTWLIIGHCISDSQNTGGYNFVINGRIVRADNRNGGGCINAMLIVFDKETSVSLSLYQNAATTLKMIVYLQAIRLG